MRADLYMASTQAGASWLSDKFLLANMVENMGIKGRAVLIASRAGTSALIETALKKIVLGID